MGKSKVFHSIKSNNKSIKWQKYFIKMPKRVYLSNITNNQYHLIVDGDEVSFYTNKKINTVNKEKIIIVNRYLLFLKQLFSKYLFTMISILAIIIMLIYSNYIIREIVFANEITEDKMIYQDVKDELYKIGPFYKLNTDLTSVTRKLQKKYYQYTYIGVSKEGSKLIIEIEMPPKTETKKEDNEQRGDLISEYDSYITGMIIKKGISLITLNQTVKKGDILVTGDLTSNDKEINQYGLVDGIILGKIGYYKTINIDKTISNKGFTGNISSCYSLSLLGKCIGNNKKIFEDYYEKKQTIFKINKIITLEKLRQYEKTIITYEYTPEEAINYAISFINYDFKKECVSKEENIINLKLVKACNNETNYELTFFILANKNIATFKPKA